MYDNFDLRSNLTFSTICQISLQIISLCCDGIFNNYSEIIMKKYQLCQDQYQSSIYSVAFVLILFGTILKGEFLSGFQFVFLRHGTIAEIQENTNQQNPSITRNTKLLLLGLFTFTGLFGSSCAGAITKRFGALRMSVTSTTRKACTLFLSLAAPGFHNKCTPEHIVGMIIFINALFVKSFSKKKQSHDHLPKAIVSEQT